MGVKITGREYVDQYHQNQQTDWLLANVGDIQELKLTCEAAIEYILAFGETISVDHVNGALVLNNGKKWRDYGFDTGETLFISFTQVATDNNTTPATVTTNTNALFSNTITAIYDNVMEVNGVSTQFLGHTILPGTRDGGGSNPNGDAANVRYEVKDLLIFSDVAPEGVRLTYSHIPNTLADSGSLNSVIDGTQATWELPNLAQVAPQPVGGPVQQMTPIGEQSGMGIISATAKFLTTKARQGIAQNYIRVYELTVKYIVSSFFSDITNFLNPLELPDYLEGIGSLTDNFKIVFYPEWNNPNLEITNDTKRTALLGNTGWFNENFNQLPNDFNVDSIKYFNPSNNEIYAISYTQRTKIVATISGVPNLSSQTKCSLGLAWVPEDEVYYKNNDRGVHQNLFVDIGDANNPIQVGAPPTQSFLGYGYNQKNFIRLSQKAEILTGKLVITVEVQPNAQLSNFYENTPDERRYIVWASVADSQLSRNFSDRVSLLLDFNEFKKALPQAGPYEDIGAKFIEHPYNEDSPGKDQYNGFVQDGFLSRFNLNIKPSKDFFRSITFGVEAYNVNDASTYTLEQVNLNLLNEAVDANAVQQIAIDQVRGFLLNAGNKNNFVKFQRDAANDDPNNANGAQYAYNVFFATKIRWEDWLERVGVPNVFFDSNELNNGYHNDWHHYATALGYELRVFTKIQSDTDDGLVEYKNVWPLSFNDYDSNEDITVSHKYIRALDGTVLNNGNDPITGAPIGVVLSNEETILEITYTLPYGQSWVEGESYAITTLEIDNGGGEFTQRQISSIYPRESGNPLEPVDGEQFLKMEYNGNSLKTTCKINSSLLTPAQRYRVTGRVGCFNQIALAGRYEAKYSSKYE